MHTFDLVVKANAKHFVTRCSAVTQFMCANSLMYCMGTHETQCKPMDIVTKASDNMNLMRPLPRAHIVTGDLGFILNMDQTPVYFCMLRKKTVDVKGVKTVHIHMSTNDMKRAMVAVTLIDDCS